MVATVACARPGSSPRGNTPSINEKTAQKRLDDLRQRAFTYLHGTYDRIRAGAAYLHFGKPENLAGYPSLYAMRK